MSEKKENLDRVDRKLLKKVDSLSGERVEKIVKELDCRTAKTLRERLDDLETKGLVFLDRKSYRGQVIASITPFGKQVIAGWAKEPASSEVSPS